MIGTCLTIGDGQLQVAFSHDKQLPAIEEYPGPGTTSGIIKQDVLSAFHSAMPRELGHLIVSGGPVKNI